MRCLARREHALEQRDCARWRAQMDLTVRGVKQRIVPVRAVRVGEAIGHAHVRVARSGDRTERLESSRAFVAELLGQIRVVERGLGAVDVVEHRAITALLLERREVTAQGQAGHARARVLAHGRFQRCVAARLVTAGNLEIGEREARARRSVAVAGRELGVDLLRAFQSARALVAGRGAVTSVVRSRAVSALLAASSQRWPASAKCPLV